MRIVCVGGGPAGLYFAILMKKRDPSHRVTVIERNRPGDTFGWGVVFSDETLRNLRGRRRREPAPRSAPVSPTGTTSTCISRAASIRSGGHGFCGIARKRLLGILQARAAALGVELRFETEVRDVERVRPSRSDRRRRRREQPVRAALRRRSSARRSTCAATASSGSARTSCSMRSPSSSCRPSTAGSRRTPTASMPRPRPSSSRPARRRGGRRPRSADAPSVDRVLRAAVRALARRPPADGEHARICAARPMDQLQPRLQRALGRRQRRADGRRRAHRAFLDRLGHEAGAGGRDRARRRRSSGTARTCRRRSRPTRRSGGSRC